MPVTQITSDSLIPIESHFRVSAGPGAGKTYWLINHIKNVLHNSNRLAKTRKIACITYTNVAVEIITERLKDSIDNVEVSTIHSFLYRHIVKPYVSFIASEYSLDIKKMDGHDDTILSNYPFLDEWKTRTAQQRIRQNNEIVNAFIKARWRFDPSNNLVIKPDYPMRADNYALKNDSYFVYKTMAWEKGILHHDDVLFFSHQLILKFPFILQVIRAKFPYFFIDEFQDTNPIQTRIVTQIGQSETIVGIVGDKAQSIYEFQGADYSQFSTFSLPNITNYEMTENRRSTDSIIDLLKTIRTDITQSGMRAVVGEKPLFLIGDMTNALNKCFEIVRTKDIYSLSRDNITSNAMKRLMDSNVPTQDLFVKHKEIDSNSDRRRIVAGCIKSIELALNKRFMESIKELDKQFRNIGDKNIRRKVVLNHLMTLLSGLNEFQDGSLYDFYSFVKSHIANNISNLVSGKIKDFYIARSYKQLAVCVKIAEDKSIHRTIHKAKGAEFENVLLVLKEEAGLDFITNPDLNIEEHRINYVAVSRTRDRLFINVPSIATARRDKITSMGYSIEAV